MELFFNKILNYIFIITSFSFCSLNNISPEIYSHPEWKNSKIQNDYIKKVIIASTNNFQGHLKAHTDLVYINKIKKNLTLKVGGANILSAYLNILRKRYPNELLVLDSGDLFNKTDLKQNQYILKLYNYLQYDGIAFSNHELQTLIENTDYLNQYPVSFINSNILDLKTGKPLEDSQLLPYKIVTVNDIKIGIIGITSPSNTSKKLYSKVKGVYFEDPVLSFLKTKKILRREKVNVTILLTQINTDCISDNPQYQKSYINSSSLQLNCPSQNDELTKFINRLPPQSIDVIITGNLNFSNGFIGNIPIIQNKGQGRYLSRIELYYDQRRKRVVKEKTTIHSPTKLCHQFFEGTQDCHTGKELPKLNLPWVGDKHRLERLKSFKLVPAKFLGMEVVFDQNIFSLFNQL